VSISGSGDVKVGGRVAGLTANIPARGTSGPGELEAQRVSVSIAGSGDATVRAHETLNVSVAGSGDVRYYGDPAVTKSGPGLGQGPPRGSRVVLMPGWFRPRGRPRSPSDRSGALAGVHRLLALHAWFVGRGGRAPENRMRSVPRRQALLRHPRARDRGAHARGGRRAGLHLVLELGIEWYEGWSEIIVLPEPVRARTRGDDEAGVVHLTNDPMAGEAWLGGPVVLSYEDVALAGDEEQRVAGYNVVIHEFAHKLDMRNGDPNGFPPLHPGMAVAAWKAAFAPAYADFCKRVDAADRLRGHRAQAALDALPIDPYAAESPGEFFAVGSEAFFETPELLAPAYPAVYEQLKLFYRQDPQARLSA
jgi:Mlc titration factor MtfA (ptsG expression regulator)